MQIRPSSWRYIGVSLISGAALAVSLAAPAIAATSSAHSALKAAKSHTNATARCKTRNKATGTIKWSDWQFPDTLSPFQTNASVSTESIDSILDGLVGFNGKGQVYPQMLAKLPKASNGGKTWTASLKKGIFWSNGQEITAADVKFGWRVAMDKASGPWCSGTCDVISRIDTKGKYGLIFHLKQVYAPFVTNALFSLPPEPTAWSSNGGWAKNDVAGAVKRLFTDQSFNFEGAGFPTDGAYTVAQFVKDDRIVFHPMKYYDTMTCGAKVANLIFAFYSSKPALIAAATAHQTDSTTDYTLADVPELNKHKGAFTLHTDPGYLIEHLTLNSAATETGQSSPNPLHNVKVRLALALALDKYGLIQSALGMSRAQANTIIAWTPLILTPKLVQAFADKQLKGQWDPIAKKYQVDTGKGQALADAKKLLTQAGHSGGGFSIDGVTTVGNPVRVAQFSVVQASWAKVGVTFKPNYIPASKLFADWDHGSPLHHGDFGVSMYADVGYPDPDGFKFDFQSKYIDENAAIHSTINANVAQIQDKVIDQAFNKAAATTNKALRQKYYNQWQVELNKQAYWINLFYRGSINTDDGHIANYSSNPTNQGEEWNTYAWVHK